MIAHQYGCSVRMSVLLDKLTKKRAWDCVLFEQDVLRPDFCEFRVVFRNRLIVSLIKWYWPLGRKEKGTLRKNSLENFSSKCLSDAIITLIWCGHLAFLPLSSKRDDSIKVPFWWPEVDFLFWRRRFFRFQSSAASLEWKCAVMCFCQEHFLCSDIRTNEY